MFVIIILLLSHFAVGFKTQIATVTVPQLEKFQEKWFSKTNLPTVRLINRNTNNKKDITIQT
jgi:hypothetical protein